MQICILVLPFRIRKKNKKKKCINENHNRNSNSPIFLLVWISKKIPESQNIRLHTPSLFLPSFFSSFFSFAHHPISSRCTAIRPPIDYSRQIYWTAVSSRISPLPSSCRRTAHASSIDTTRVAAVAQHKSNENQQRPSCV